MGAGFESVTWPCLVLVLAALAAASSDTCDAISALQKSVKLGASSDVTEVSSDVTDDPLWERPRPPDTFGAASARQVHARRAPGATSPDPQVDARPPDSGRPTLVKFAMLGKEFYGVDMKKSTVMMDIVLTLEWQDNRTKALVPAGLSNVTFSQERAEAVMWMPSVAITNRDLGGSQLTSSAVTASMQGVVQMVQRLLVVAKNSFDIRAFPFDTQSLRFRIASTTLMADELQLQNLAEEGMSGVRDGIFEGKNFDFVSAATSVFQDKDGALVKSRGELVIKVRRNSAIYFKNLIVPELLLVGIAYTVFLFPRGAPFIMPRVAMSVMSFMALMLLSLRTSAMLPTRASSSWIDEFSENCTMIMFTTLCLNVTVEIVEHEMELHSVGRAMQRELQIGHPIVVSVVICICFLRTDGTGLWWLDVSTKCVFLVVLIPYLCWCVKRAVTVREEMIAQKVDAAA